MDPGEGGQDIVKPQIRSAQQSLESSSVVRLHLLVLERRDHKGPQASKLGAIPLVPVDQESHPMGMTYYHPAPSWYTLIVGLPAFSEMSGVHSFGGWNPATRWTSWGAFSWTSWQAAAL